MTLYNEIDPFAATWLERLIEAGHITSGTVDRRSIKDVQAEEIKGVDRVHLFAGIGGWDLALQLAGWPADRPVWTGSCPCQPFSAAGKRKGQSDDRHLWPDMFRLVRQCRPDTIFGEQVASAIGHGWLDGVFADLEREGYTCGAVVLGAHSVGAPHIRQRLWWVADSGRSARERNAGRLLAAKAGVSSPRELDGDLPVRSGDGVATRRLADTNGGNAGAEREQRSGQQRLQPQDGGVGGVEHATSDGREQRRAESNGRGVAGGREHGGLAQPECPAGQPDDRAVHGVQEPVRQGGADRLAGVGEGSRGRLAHAECERGRGRYGEGENANDAFPPGSLNWQRSKWHYCRDGKARRIPIEPALFPLAHGLPGRVGLLRGAGNAIVPQVAAEFIRSFMEVQQ